MIGWDDLCDLPGAALVERGVRERQRGARSAEALLVSTMSRRLGHYGFDVPVDDLPADRDLALYAALEERGGYRRYNAMRRELASFMSALAHRARRIREASAER